MYRKAFGGQVSPEPTGELTALPGPLTGFWARTGGKGKGGKGMEGIEGLEVKG